MSISASEKPLSKVFTSDYRFTIPSFQRSYSWHDAQMRQLVNDVMDACALHDGPYFLGSLILVHDERGMHQVIDGQQRLVSLSILFSILLALEEDPQLTSSLEGLLMEAGDKLRGIKRSRDSPCVSRMRGSSANTCSRATSRRCSTCARPISTRRPSAIFRATRDARTTSWRVCRTTNAASSRNTWSTMSCSSS